MSGVIAAAGISAAAGIGGALLTPKGGGTQTSTSTSQIDQGAASRERDNWDLSVQTANQLMGPYQGQRVADLTPQQQQLIQQLYGRVGSTDAAYDQASGIVNGLTGFNSGQLQSQYLRDANLSPYMNPYSRAVIDPGLKDIDSQRRQALNQIGATAAQTGAFGGSRQGVSEGVTNTGAMGEVGRFVGNQMSQNFLQAQQAAAGDIGRNWQEQTANMGARQFDAGFQAQRADQLANLAAGKQQSFLAGLSPAMQAQEAQRQIEQQRLAAEQQYYLEQRKQPLDVLQIRQNALASGMPLYARETSSSAPSGTSTSPLMAGLGTASTVAGLFGTLGKAGGWGSSGSGYTTNDQMRTTDAEIADWSRR